MELSISKEDFKKIVLENNVDSANEYEDINEDLEATRKGIIVAFWEGGPEAVAKLEKEVIDEDEGTLFSIWCYSNGYWEIESDDEFADTFYEFMQYLFNDTGESEYTELKHDLKWMLSEIENQLRDGL